MTMQRFTRIFEKFWANKRLEPAIWGNWSERFSAQAGILKSGYRIDSIQLTREERGCECLKMQSKKPIPTRSRSSTCGCRRVGMALKHSNICGAATRTFKRSSARPTRISHGKKSPDD